MKKITVLLAEDHQLVREGFRSLLKHDRDLEVVGEAETGRQAVQMTRKLRPEVVVMDIAMPLLNGLEATRQIRKEAPGTEVMIFTLHDRESEIRDVLHAGARGYVLKSEADEQIVRAVEALARHHAYFSDHVSETLLDALVEQAGSSGNGVALTAREREVVQLIAEGNSNKKIAHLLSISVKTVETHRSASMRKLDIHSTAELVRYAVRHGLILP